MKSIIPKLENNPKATITKTYPKNSDGVIYVDAPEDLTWNESMVYMMMNDDRLHGKNPTANDLFALNDNPDDFSIGEIRAALGSLRKKGYVCKIEGKENRWKLVDQ